MLIKLYQPNIWKIITLSLVMCYSIGLKGQNIDSLRLLLSSLKGIEKVDVLLEIAEQQSPYQGETVAKQALQLAQHLAYPKGEALAFRWLGNFYTEKRDSNALSYLHQAETILDELNERQELLQVWIDLIHSYFMLYEYMDAIRYGERAIRLSEELKDSISLGYSHLKLSYVYIRFDKKRFFEEEKTNNATQALHIFKKKENPKGLINTYIFLTKLPENPDSSIAYLNKAYSLLTQLPEGLSKRNLSARVCDFLSFFYTQKKDYLSSEKWAKKALLFYQETNNKGGISIIQGRIGEIQYIHYKNYEEAIGWLKKAMQYEMDISRYYHVVFYTNLIKNIYKKKQEYKKAVEFSELTMTYQDSQYHADREDVLETITQKSNEEHQKVKINYLNHQNQLQKLVFSIIAFLLALLIFLLLRQYRLKNRNQAQKLALLETQKEQQALKIEHLKVQESLVKQLKKDKKTIEKQAKKLKHLDKIKSRFFANMSHELRTPLTLILGPAKSILERAQINNRDFTFVKMIQQNAQQLLKLVNEILDLNKLESEKLVVVESTEVFYPLMKRILANFESQAHILNIQLNFHYQLDPYLQLVLDKNKLTIILNNLLSNALKFTASSGTIDVYVKDMAHTILIEVKDSGQGIHADDIDHIFNRFYQSQQKDATIQGGTGIGLALSLEYAHLMKGDLKVKSQLGQGSTFSFTFYKKEAMGISNILKIENETDILPVTQDAFLGMETLIHEKKDQAIQEKSTLLVVEDNLNLSEYLQLILAEKFQVLCARNGKEALDILETTPRPPSLIISDIMMPVMNGFELLQSLKSSEKWQQIPVIMLTARTQMKDKLKALRIGVDDYLSKPFEEEELFARINNLLKNHQARLVAQQEEHPHPFLQHIALSDMPENLHKNISKEKLEWLQTLENLVEKEIDSFHFGVEELAYKMSLSTRQLLRRLKETTGLRPQQYIVEVKLSKAREGLETGQFTSVKSAAFAVAMKDVKYFSKLFKKRFGRLPSSYFS